ncbi:cupin domain-containing protein (plasmid) [Mycobacterium sp. TJFP1]
MTVWSSTTDADLVPYPEDDALVVDGDVRAGMAVLRDTHEDGVSLLTGIWSASPSTLEMAFEGDETIVVLEGSAHVTVGDIDVFLSPGTTASFKPGGRAMWHIPEPFKQFFVLVSRAH